MSAIELKNVVKEYAGKRLFSIDKLTLEPRDRVGVVGGNGQGKSTLLRLILGLDHDYGGSIVKKGSLAYLPQIKEKSPQSGGEQTMELIKQVLRERADTLLLDEPTANLDSKNKKWLLHQLRRYRGSLVIVSHDRDFLNQLVTRIWWLENQQLAVYQGTYEEAKRQRQKDREKQAQAFQSYQRKKKQLENRLEEKKVKAKKLTKKKKTVSSSDWKVNSRIGAYDGKAKALAKNAKAMEKRIERLESHSQPRKEAWAKLDLKGQLDQEVHTLFRLEEGQVDRQERFLFHYPALGLKMGERLGIRGRNGSGKTTFLERLRDKKLPGYYASNLKIAYFSQNTVELDEERTALSNARTNSIQSKEVVFNVLGMLGLSYQKALQKTATLSGGERGRLALAQILLSDANLLILDEPTNFLDIVVTEALEEFLSHYPGSLLLVSHDESFLQATCPRQFILETGELKEKLETW